MFHEGVFFRDEDTIPSIVRRCIGNKYIVINKASEYKTENIVARQIRYHAGDIVVLPLTGYRKDYVNDEILGKNYIDLTEILNKASNTSKHIFDDAVHFDGYISEMLANQIACHILDRVSSIGKNSNSRCVTFGGFPKRISSIADNHLKKWLEEERSKIERWEIETGINADKVGAIVMNCNPFTNGHRYLIEKAAGEVDAVFVFVVSEDKSIFKAADRMEMVRRGTSDLINVYVTNSGKYMISSMSLPGYFNKEKNNDKYVDTSMDIMLFLQIAFELNISVRYVAEEPKDLFTRQYNENMKEILPDYGIELREIGRLSRDGEIISASSVRKYMLDGDEKKMESMVPHSTIQYLREHGYLGASYKRG